MDLSLLGTLKHAQIAAIEWNREAIARVKTGAGAGMPGTCHAFLLKYAPLLSEMGCVAYVQYRNAPAAL